jgi:hypothetical protein
MSKNSVELGTTADSGGRAARVAARPATAARVCVVLLLTACGEEKPAPADTAVATAPAPQPSVAIVSPAEGDTVSGDVTIVMTSEGVTIEKANSTRVEGVGHYHLFVDTTATPDGEVIPPATARMIHIGTGDSTYTLTGLAPGRHEVIAVIGYGDHAAMPSRRDTVTFVVRR